MKTVLFLFVLFVCNVLNAQQSVYCDYVGAWKIEAIESPSNTAYLDLLQCNFFISEDGHTGCYASDANEVICRCCWKKEEKRSDCRRFKRKAKVQRAVVERHHYIAGACG